MAMRIFAGRQYPLSIFVRALAIVAILLSFLTASATWADDPPPVNAGFYTRLKPTPAAEKPAEQYSGYVPSDAADPVVVPSPASHSIVAVGPAEPAGPAVVAAVPLPTPGPQRQAPAQSAPSTPQGQQPGSQAVERLLERKLGSESFQALLNSVAEAKGDDGSGAPTASQYFDRAAPRLAARSDPVSPTQSTIFQRPQSTGAYLGATQADAAAALKDYKGIPGGVVLEGLATFGALDSLGYDARFNALVINDSAVYLVKISPAELAAMCRALAQDDRLGVSLGAVHQVYGGVPPNSSFALDMKIADHFMGGIVFAQDEWLHGYALANGYEPVASDGTSSGGVAVFFTFGGFRFALVEGEITATEVKLDVRLFPLSDQLGPDGSLQPDFDRIARNDLSPQYQANARHIAENIDYYRNEPIIERMFQYGEVAAVLRGLKYRGFDLEALGAQIG